MPGWRDAVEDLYQAGGLQVVGIIEEQHADRCRLFMQWKRMDWPILVDSLNLLQMEAVPVTVAIDEHGIVREKRLRLDAADAFRDGFMKAEFPAPESVGPSPTPAVWPKAAAPGNDAGAEAWSSFGESIVLSGDRSRISEAVEAYRRAAELDPDDGWKRFRLGTALRMRHDSEHRAAGDFQGAVDAWKAALDLDPNQYIWRRRIQQYGPRLDKPYPFYDWVPTAREEIRARGETPAELIVEPGGAEFASPVETLASDGGPGEHPDPEGRVYRDEEGLIGVEVIAAPRTIAPGEALRLHVEFRPREEVKAHWNNEVDGLETWIEEPDGCAADAQYRLLDNPPEAVSLETRRLEYEVRCGEDAPPGPRELSGYALYYVCEDVDGTCLYRRQEFGLTFEVQ